MGSVPGTGATGAPTCSDTFPNVDRLGINPDMRSYRMTIAYDGSAYAGWQVQPGVVTIQEQIETALRQIVGTEVRVVASGRTDSGVHARAQVVSFRCNTRLEPAVLKRALEANTPDDICVLNVAIAPEGFHAIRDAVTKRYRYVIQDGLNRDLFERCYSWHIPHPLDDRSMREAAECLVGKHDFSSFEAAGAPRKTSIRTIHDLQVMRTESSYVRTVAIEVEADGFLYNMVRNIVGSLVLIGRGKHSVGWLSEVLAARDRSQAGPTAPAHGLTLLFVRYE